MSSHNICKNYEADAIISNLNIGYSRNSTPVFIIIPLICIVMNMAVLATYFKKRKNNGNQ